MRFVKAPSGLATALSAAADPSLMKLPALAEEDFTKAVVEALWQPEPDFVIP